MVLSLCAIAVMAKAPRAGRVKTRLCPPLTPDQAEALSCAFLADITANLALAARTAPLQGFVAYAPAGTEALFDGTLAPGTPLLLADGGEGEAPGVAGFGRSLLHAMRAQLARGYAAACLLNADSPTLPTAFLCEAARLLMEPRDRVVLGPAEDGGYYLLGARAAHARLFADIDWSTDRVAAQTRARASEAGLELVELPSWFDIDDAASLARLDAPPAGDAEPYAASCARACLAGFDSVRAA